MGLNFATGEFPIPGSGTADVSWTTAEDVAKFVAFALTTLPREKIEWRLFRIEGDRMVSNSMSSHPPRSIDKYLLPQSLDGIASLWEKQFGKSVTISHHSRAPFEEAVKKNPMDFVSLFILALDDGLLTVGNANELANDEYPDWNPKKVVDVLANLHSS